MDQGLSNNCKCGKAQPTANNAALVENLRATALEHERTLEAINEFLINKFPDDLQVAGMPFGVVNWSHARQQAREAQWRQTQEIARLEAAGFTVTKVVPKEPTLEDTIKKVITGDPAANGTGIIDSLNNHL